MWGAAARLGEITLAEWAIAKMTPDDLRAWQKRMGFTYDTAAAALGIGRTTYADQLRKDKIPHTIFLATVAVEYWTELQDIRKK